MLFRSCRDQWHYYVVRGNPCLSGCYLCHPSMLHGIDTHDQEYTNVQSGSPCQIRDVCCILLRLYLVLPLPLDDIQSMSETEVIGPIQMGLNKPIHFTDCEASVRDIVNITAVAVIDAIVDKKKKEK